MSPIRIPAAAILYDRTPQAVAVLRDEWSDIQPVAHRVETGLTTPDVRFFITATRGGERLRLFTMGATAERDLLEHALPDVTSEMDPSALPTSLMSAFTRELHRKVDAAWAQIVAARH